MEQEKWWRQEGQPGNSRAPSWVRVEAQGHLVSVSCRGAMQKGGGKRGEVALFSKSSRKRLLEKMARLVPESCQFHPSLITLTYGAEWPEPAGAKRDLFTFWKRVRRAWPESSAIWRLEFQQRGAPHFHLIYFGPFFGKERVQDWWGEVIGQARPFTRIELLENWRHGLAYAAKYLAKVPDPAGSPVTEGPLERADAGGTAEGGAGAASDSGLDYVTYLTGGEGLGRVWGVLDRRNLPWGEKWEFPLPMGKWLYRWKRCARHKWRGVSRKRWSGGSLFVDDPEAWVRLAVIEQGEEQPGGTED